MTIARSTLLAVGSSGTAASSYTTASASPVANRLLIWCQGSIGNQTHNAPTAWGLTWTQINQQAANARSSMWYAWTGNTNPTAGTATVNFAANVNTAWWYCASIQNARPAPVQSNVSTHSAASSGGASLSSSTAQSDLSVTIAMICNGSDSTATVTAERTGLGSASAGTTPYRGRFAVQWSGTAVWDSNMTWTWSGSINGSSIIAEIGHILRAQPSIYSLVKN